MLIHQSTQERLIAETTAAAGTTSKEGSLQTDSLLCSLWVDSVTSGTLTVSVYTLTDTGKEALLFTFPVITTATTNLLLKRKGVSMSRFRVVATYTGICQYEVYVRAITGVPDTGIFGWTVSQANVTTVAAALIPASQEDRAGLLIKNWSSSSTVFLAETLGSATTAVGYPLGPKDAIAMDITAGSSVYAISDVGTADIRIVESGQ
jgi:hypothetical protein